MTGAADEKSPFIPCCAVGWGKPERVTHIARAAGASSFPMALVLLEPVNDRGCKRFALFAHRDDVAGTGQPLTFCTGNTLFNHCTQMGWGDFVMGRVKH